MLRRIGAALIALTTLDAAAPGSARADVSMHVLASVDVSATDNVFSVPDNDPTGAPVESDLFYVFRPGILVTQETPRMVHELTVDGDVNAYTKNADAFSATARAAWKSLFYVSPLTEVQASASASRGTLNALTARIAPDAGVVTVVPPGDVTLTSADLGEQLSHDLNYDWRLGQNVTVRWLKSEDSSGGVGSATRTLETALGGSATRAWREDSATADVTVSYLDFDRGEGVVGEPNQINTRGRLQWRHDLGPRWTALLEGGAVAVLAVSGTGGDSSPVVLPVAGATLTYTPLWGQAAVSVRRDVVPNLFIAQNTVTDTAAANLSLPLPWLRKTKQEPTMYFAASGGYVRTRLIDANEGMVQGNFHSWLGDAALQYNPRRNVGIALRYQYIRQSGDADALTQVLGFVRNTVSLSVTLRFPDKVAAEVPKRNGARADGGDLKPIDGTVDNSVNGDLAPGLTR